MSADEGTLTNMFHEAGDVWSPEADQAELARSLNEQIALGSSRPLARSASGERRGAGVPALRPGRAFRIGLTVCVLAAAIVVPVALRLSRSQPPPSGKGGRLAVTALRLPFNFFAASADLAMSCGGPSSCLVVGSMHAPSGRTVPAYLTLVGGEWSGPDPLPAGITHEAPFAEVSCASTAYCVGVSAVTSVAGRNRVYIAQFDGVTWKPLSAPTALDVLLRTLRYGINLEVQLSCPQAGSCILIVNTGAAVGPVDTYELAGARWSGPSPFPGDPETVGYGLSDISCVDVNSCWVTGTVDTQPGPRLGAVRFGATVLRWNGTTWRDLPTPPPPPFLPAKGLSKAAQEAERGAIEAESGHVNVIPGISCDGAATCYAVNVVETAPAAQTVVVTHGRGWSAVYSPKWPPAFSDIACVAGSFCLVSGEPGYDQTHVQPYAMLLGGKWSTVDVQLPGTEYLAVFGDLDCPSAQACYQLYSTNTYKPYAQGTSYVLEMQPSGS